jgi:hypothetical protein
VDEWTRLLETSGFRRAESWSTVVGNVDAVDGQAHAAQLFLSGQHTVDHRPGTSVATEDAPTPACFQQVMHSRRTQGLTVAGGLDAHQAATPTDPLLVCTTSYELVAPVPDLYDVLAEPHVQPGVHAGCLPEALPQVMFISPETLEPTPRR